jgi:hypothetical protein
MAPSKNQAPLVDEGEASNNPDGSIMPKLVPITPGEIPTDTSSENIHPGEGGGAPPAVSPSVSIPTESPLFPATPLNPVPVTPVTPPPAYAPPVPAAQTPPQLAPTVMPVVSTTAPTPRAAPAVNTYQTAMPRMAPTANTYQTTMPRMAPTVNTYQTTMPRVAPATTLELDGRPKRTIINEGVGHGYSSLTDPNLSPGLHGRRFAPSNGGTSGTSSTPGF